MKNYFLILFTLWGLCIQPIRAQVLLLDSNLCKALNNYVVFSNEVVQASGLMYEDFEQINLQMNAYLEKKTPISNYEKIDVLGNYDLFTELPKNLYSRIYQTNAFIPANRRKQLYDLINQTHTIMEKMEGLRVNFESYINTGAYRKDSLLTKGYNYLQQVELAYIDLFILQQRLHQNIASIVSVGQKNPKNEPNLYLLQQLYPLIGQSQQLFFTVKNDNPAKDLRRQNVDFSTHLLSLRQNAKNLLAHQPKIDTSVFCYHKRFDTILHRAQRISEVVLDYSQNAQKYQNLAHKPHFYYYNQELIWLHNRPNDGLVIAYNKMLNAMGENWVMGCELPFNFEVLYPNLPAFDKYREQFEMPDPAELARIWQQRQDSLRADSLRLANEPAKVGDKSLKGFATNNLIFLVDVSSSMAAAQKLPLFKKSLQALLPILRSEDLITIITYSGKAKLVLPPTSGSNQEQILQVIGELNIQGLSDAEAGLTLGYETAFKTFIEGGNNRILLVTDGKFEIGRKTRNLIKKGRKNSLFLSAFYFDEKEFKVNKENLIPLTELGGGNYRYIQPDNAEQTLLIEAQSFRKSN